MIMNKAAPDMSIFGCSGCRDQAGLRSDIAGGVGDSEKPHSMGVPAGEAVAPSSSGGKSPIMLCAQPYYRRIRWVHRPCL